MMFPDERKVQEPMDTLQNQDQRRRRCHRVRNLVLFGFVAPLAWADSKLPRPPKKDEAATVKSVPETPHAEKELQVTVESCHSEFTSQAHPRIYADGSHVYYLSRLDSAGQDLFHYELLKLGPAQKKQSIFKTVGPEHVVLIPHGQPVNGFSIISLSETMGGCSGGVGEGATIPSRTTTHKRALSSKTFPEAKVHWFESTQGRLVQDLTKMFVRTVDPNLMQQRVLYQVMKGAQVLYWDARRQWSYQWLGSPKRLLTRTSSQGQKNLVEISVPAGQKIVQDEDRFALVELNATENMLSIFEIVNWATRPQTREHKIKLPQGMFVDQADLRIRFANQFAVISQNPERPSTWGKLLLFKLDKGLLSELSITKAARISGIQMTSDAEYPVIVVSELLSSKRHHETKVWSSTKSAWVDL